MNILARTLGTLMLGFVLLGTGRLPAVQAQTVHHHRYHQAHPSHRYRHYQLHHPGVYVHYGIHHSHHRYH